MHALLPIELMHLVASRICVFVFDNQSKKKGKDKESKQSGTPPDAGYQWESDNFTIRPSQTKAKRSALSQQVSTRHQNGRARNDTRTKIMSHLMDTLFKC